MCTHFVALAPAPVQKLPRSTPPWAVVAAIILVNIMSIIVIIITIFLRMRNPNFKSLF